MKSVEQYFPDVEWRHKGRIWIGAVAQGIIRAGPKALIQAEHSTRLNLPLALQDYVPKIINFNSSEEVAWLLEEHMGDESPDPIACIQQWDQAVEWRKTEPIMDTVRNLLKSIKPHVKLKPTPLKDWVSAKKLNRALDQKITVCWSLGWTHGALISRRIRQSGFICWRKGKEDGRRGEDLATFATPRNQSPDILLHIAKANWATNPEKAFEALKELGVLTDKRLTSIHINAHPAIAAPVIYKIVGTSPGDIEPFKARQAVGRAKGILLGGKPILVKTDPPVIGKADSAFHNRRNRKDTALFSLFHSGIQLDQEGRFSLTPEKEALKIAERLPKGQVLDAFCGCGGNAIAFARSGFRVTAVDTNKARLQMARHNARIYSTDTKIEWILGDAFNQKPTGGGIFVDPPWSWAPKQIQDAWIWAKQWPWGAIKLPKEHPIPDNAFVDVLLSPENYPRAIVAYWGLPYP